MNFKQSEKQELQPIAQGISKLPSKDLLPETSLVFWNEIQFYFYWLGRGLEAYFSDEPNPIDNAGFSEEMVQALNASIFRYLELSKLFYLTEKLLRNEAQAQGITYLNDLRRSDFLMIWAREECIFQITLNQQYCWESLGKGQNKERKREILKFYAGEISDKKMKLLKDRWSKEDLKLNQSIDIEDTMSFTSFVLGVLNKYRKKIPQLKNFLEVCYADFNPKKFTVVNGEILENPVRGKDKKKRKPNS